MAKVNRTDILSQVINLLEPLKSEERKRIMQASMTFLGEAPIKTADAIDTADNHGGDANIDNDDNLPVRARQWFKQNGISLDHLQHVFHIENEKVEIIAPDIPGKSDKEKTINAYVLTGLSRFLLTGESKFDDKLARSICVSTGCYDATNHATYMKAKGNYLSGSKESGWTITGPGLKHGAEVVKQIANG